MNHPGFLGYWGKAGDVHAEADGDPPWHRLAFHSLDVAAIGRVLLEHDLQLLARIATSAGLPPTTIVQLLPWLLALHDLGKFKDHIAFVTILLATCCGERRPWKSGTLKSSSATRD
jgi:CRISPR-associated endonuclease/helicase Cas3